MPDVERPHPTPATVTRSIPVIGAFGRTIGLAGLVGLAAGAGAVIFYFALQATQAYVQRMLIGLSSPAVLGEPDVVSVAVGAYRPWLLLVLPALGGLASGLITWMWAPEAAGHGTDAAIDAYHRKAGYIRPQVPFIKAVTAALVIGSGGSGGREGPIAQIGAGMGSFLGMAFNLSQKERRTLMAAGMGAGVGAIFRAPLAGALFAGEILYSTAFIEPEVLLPAIVASIVAYSVFGTAFGWESLLRVPHVGFSSPLELVPYTVLAAVATLAGLLFVRSFYGVHSVFARWSAPSWIKPCVGACMTGGILFFVPGAGFTGYGEIQEALLGHRSVHTLLILAMLRIITTSFSIGSGGSGGVFGPSMVIGGCLGGAVGMFFYQAWPGLIQNPASFVIVGMAGFFAGIAHAPISTIIMVSEMTGNYGLLVPAMWVCSITFLTSTGVSLYRLQVASRGDSPAHQARPVPGCQGRGIHDKACGVRALGGQSRQPPGLSGVEPPSLLSGHRLEGASGGGLLVRPGQGTPVEVRGTRR